MATRPPTTAPWWLFCLAVVAAWLLGVELAVFTEIGRNFQPRLPALAVWSFVVVSIAFLAVTGRREIAGGRQTLRLIVQLKDALGSIGMLTETSLAALPLDELLAQLLGRLREVLETEVAAILVCEREGQFAFRASDGLDVDVLNGFAVASDQGMIAAIAATSLPQTIADPGRLDILASQLHHRFASAAGCPILVDGRLVGICIVGSDGPRRFDDRRLELLQLVADRAGVGIERARLSESQQESRADAEQARRHAAMLARASEVLLSATDDYEDRLAALGEVVVPDFADWVLIELSGVEGAFTAFAGGDAEGSLGDGGGAAELDGSRPVEPDADRKVGHDAVRRPAAADVRARFPATAALAAVVLAFGRPQTGVDGRTIVVAIQVGDSVYGTMTFAIDPGRPGYSPNDEQAATELAARAAITVERVLRYRDARDTARASQRRAAQLHQLVRASIDVQQLRDESEIVANIAERARRVFDARTAVVTAHVGSDGPLQAVAKENEGTVLVRPGALSAGVDLPHPAGADGQPWRADGWLGAPVPGHQSGAGGTMAILGAPGADFSADDEAVLVLLAQMMSAALDNAELHHTTEASEARWRVLVETAPIGIVEVDLDGEILWWNRAAMALFAWPETQQRPAREWRSERLSGVGHQNGHSPSFAPDTAAGLRIIWSTAAAGTAVIDRELSAASAAGDIRDLAISAAPLRSGAGPVDGILTLVADVTDRRRFEAELRRAQRMEAVAQLAGGVAHDFNNLLTLITGYTDLLNRRLDVDAHSIRLVDGVHSAVTRASLLTGQLLTISRRQTSRPVVLAPVDALRSAAEVLERVLGAGVELRWDLDPASGQIRIDPAQLEQVILNLAINARDAMPGGGRLDVAVSPAQLDTSQAGALEVRPGRYVKISVSDTGTGMDAATCLRCFEPLFTTKGPSYGTGLGLAAVEGVVEESGGAVRVESTPGLGTTFVVYLPAVAEPAAGRENPGVAGSEPSWATECHSGSAPRPDAPTILIAEDDEPLRHLMSQVLTRDGYRVLVAADGCDAVTVAGDWDGTIDAMISDIVMPGMSGSDVAATLLIDRPMMRVLFVSGGPDASTPAAAPPDPQSLLAKPFKPSQLVARVHELLGA